MVFNDIILTNVRFDGDRHNTACDLAVAHDQHLHQHQLYQRFCDMGTIDIPVSTNKFATDCIAFVLLVEPRYHAEFVDRLNGLVIFRSIKITIRLGRHPPKLIAPVY